MKRANELLKHDPDAQIRLKNYVNMPLVSKMNEISEYKFDNDRDYEQREDAVFIKSKIQRIETKLEQIEYLVKKLSKVFPLQNMKDRNDLDITERYDSSNECKKAYKKIKLSKEAIAYNELSPKKKDIASTSLKANFIGTSQYERNEDVASPITSACSSLSKPSSSITVLTPEEEDVPEVTQSMSSTFPIRSQIVSLEMGGNSLLWDDEC
jgi:hypothetical protein